MMESKDIVKNPTLSKLLDILPEHHMSDVLLNFVSKASDIEYEVEVTEKKDGHLKKQTIYVDGIDTDREHFNFEISQVYENGCLKKQKIFLNDMLQEKKTWHSNGIQKNCFTYRNNEFHGVCTIYNNRGTCLLKRTFLNGLLHGDCEERTEEDVIISKRNYAKGRRDGVCIEWCNQKRAATIYQIWKKGTLILNKEGETSEQKSY